MITEDFQKKIKYQGQWGDSAGKGTYHQLWGHRFDPQDPHDWKREPSHTNCPLVSREREFKTHNTHTIKGTTPLNVRDRDSPTVFELESPDWFPVWYASHASDVSGCLLNKLHWVWCLPEEKTLLLWHVFFPFLFWGGDHPTYSFTTSFY